VPLTAVIAHSQFAVAQPWRAPPSLPLGFNHADIAVLDWIAAEGRRLQHRSRLPNVGLAEIDSAIEVKMAMRKLWEDHITWTRNVIISALAGLEDLDAVTQRLLKNQDDIGDAVTPYYGDAAGKKLSSLLHVLIAAAVIKAAKANDNAELAAQQKKWSANGKDIAAFLSGANPNWPKQDLEGMLQQ
jgi:hypothetical protein